MYFKQIAVEGMGCLSYLIGCPKRGVACVVDPKRDVDSYIEIARENGMLITHVFETHIHSDHVSGSFELRMKAGADIYLMEGTYEDFECRTVNEGDIIELGDPCGWLRRLATTGSASVHAAHRQRPSQLRIGAVGRH